MQPMWYLYIMYIQLNGNKFCPAWERFKHPGCLSRSASSLAKHVLTLHSDRLGADIATLCNWEIPNYQNTTRSIPHSAKEQIQYRSSGKKKWGGRRTQKKCKSTLQASTPWSHAWKAVDGQSFLDSKSREITILPLPNAEWHVNLTHK